MEYIDHDHKHTVKRGGSIMSGSSNYDDNIVLNTPEYNKHDLSHTFKATAKLGTIYPVLNLHCVSGDSFRFSPNISQRFRPLVSPISSTLESILHTFYVPTRMCDFGFEKFLTGGVNGTYQRKLLTFSFPGSPYPSTPLGNISKCHSIPLFGPGSLADFLNYGSSVERDHETGMYFGHGFAAGIGDVYPFVAYHRIYNDYYRAKEVETDLFCQIEQPTSVYTWVLDLCRTINKILWQDPSKQDDYSFQLLTYSLPDPPVGTYRRQPADLLFNILRTDSRFTGFCHWLLWYMTSPDAEPIRRLYHGSVSGGTTPFYDWQNNRIRVGNLFTSHNAPPSTSSTASNTAILLDYLIGVWAVLMLSPEFFPWERDRFTTVLPYLMRGQSVALETLVGINQDLDESPASLQFVDGILKHSGSDLSTVKSSFTIDELRKINAMTRFLERNARIGYIFDEWLEGVFGIEPKREDHLVRPNYVGGTKFTAEVETITSTSETELANLGDYRGTATSFGDCSFDYNIPEHGVVLSLFACKPRTSLLGYIDRNNCKYADRTLFYTPDFAHLTEQPVFRDEFDNGMDYMTLSQVLNGELDDVTADILGYEPRYNEYRSMSNTVHGELLTSLVYFTTGRNRFDVGAFANDFTETSSDWHNNVFFQHVFPDQDSVNRIFQVSSGFADHFILSVGWDLDSLRLIPRQAIPSLT